MASKAAAAKARQKTTKGKKDDAKKGSHANSRGAAARMEEVS